MSETDNKIDSAISENCINCVFEQDMLNQVIEVKEMLQYNTNFVSEHFEKLQKLQESEITTLRKQLESKDEELVKCRAELDVLPCSGIRPEITK